MKKKRNKHGKYLFLSSSLKLFQKTNSVPSTLVIYSCKKYTMNLDYTKFVRKLPESINLILNFKNTKK